MAPEVTQITEQNNNLPPSHAPSVRKKAISTWWNKERTEYLVKNWTLKSASVLAEEMGCSRNAVIGRVYRMRLPHKGQDGQPFERKPSVPGPRVKRMSERRNQPAPEVESEQAPVVLEPNPADNVSLVDLQGNHCRYPLGKGEDGFEKFCGSPKYSGSYCYHHAKICYNFDAPRRR